VPKPTFPAFPDAPGSLLETLILIIKSGVSVNAGERHRHLLAALRGADCAQLEALAGRPAERALAAGLVHALLDELDERRAAAAAEVARLLGAAAPALVGWPE
jgi:hypothetical protein